MKKITVAHNQGFGDHIICNGLIRTLSEKYDNVEVMFLASNGKSHRGSELVKYMYRDDPKITIIETDDEAAFIDSLVESGKDHLVLGHSQFTPQFKLGNINFDEGFYHFAGIDFENRFSKFYIERDELEEERVFRELTKGNKEYIFLHDDPERGFRIDRSKVRKDLPIIENVKSINFFNYRKLFENAKELHLMQSGIFDFTNSIPLPNTKIHVHTYVRGYSPCYWTASIIDRTVVS